MGGAGLVVVLVALACGHATNDMRDGDSGGAAGNSNGGASASGNGAGAGNVGTSGTAGARDNAGEGGDAGAGARMDSFVPLATSSWQTTLTLEMTQPPPVGFSCTSVDFVLHVEPRGSQLDVISGGRYSSAYYSGQLSRSTESSTSYESRDSLSFPSGACTSSSEIHVTELRLRARDDDSDGTPDAIEGEGKAEIWFYPGDVGLKIDVTFQLRGVPDTQRPTLFITSGAHPLDPVNIRTSEPVSLLSAVTLSNSSGKVLLTAGTVSVGALSRFSSDIVLPFGSSWDVEATGQDLIGLPFDSALLTPYTLLADPGLFAQDGFESASLAVLNDGAEVVAKVGNLPAIAGSKSLFVPRGGSATLHLARPAGGANLRLTTRMLSTNIGEREGTPPIEIGVVGGSARQRPVAPTSIDAPSPTGDAVWAYAYPQREMNLPLSDTGSEIAVRIAIPFFCRPPCAALQAVLIDELRVE